MTSAPVVGVARRAARHRQVNRPCVAAIASNRSGCNTWIQGRWLRHRSRNGCGTVVCIGDGDRVGTRCQACAVLRRWLTSAPVVGVARRAACDRQIYGAIRASEALHIRYIDCWSQLSRLRHGGRNGCSAAISIRDGHRVSIRSESQQVLRRTAVVPNVSVTRRTARHRQIDLTIRASIAGDIRYLNAWDKKCWLRHRSRNGCCTVVCIRDRHCVSACDQVCTILRGNTSAPVVSIARRAARHCQVNCAVVSTEARHRGHLYSWVERSRLCDGCRDCFGAAVSISNGHCISACNKTCAILRCNTAAPVVSKGTRAARCRHINRTIGTAEATHIGKCAANVDACGGLGNGSRGGFGTPVGIGHGHRVGAGWPPADVLGGGTARPNIGVTRLAAGHRAYRSHEQPR